MTHVRRWLLVAGIVGLASVGIWQTAFRRPSPIVESAPATQVATPEAIVSPFESPFRNTHAATFTGSRGCAECHSAEAAAFESTPHHHSLERILPGEEPPDGEFTHTASGRTYQVYRSDGQLWHREFLAGAGESEFVLGEYPMAWRIGSGHHSRSYLVDIDGFLFESPVTWYAAEEMWAISPGYDFPDHEGFSRAAHEGCVDCHTGRVEAVGQTTHQLRMIQPAINCESCHGPGSLHVTERTAGRPVTGDFDDSIVHPGKLSRDLNEAVCARCHQRGEGWALVRGQRLRDFRPGLPLTDYRVDYTQRDSSGAMKVVGHFEQMHASRCYTESEALTCTTCHNPHHAPPPGETIAFYRDKCLTCHGRAGSDAEDGCRLEKSARLQTSPQNDCVQCHMPRSGTDIPHFTFTHHRIGLAHPLELDEEVATGQLPELVPVGDLSRLSPLERQRCLALAWSRYADSLKPPTRFEASAEALNRLEHVYRSGLRDAGVLGGLAFLYWKQRDPVCVDFARQALDAPDCDAETRTNVLIVLGDMSLEHNAVADAAAAFKQLTQVRLRYTDWQMLGMCNSRLADRAGAIAAYRKAIELQPAAVHAHLLLADELASSGEAAAARQHRQTAAALKKSMQPPP